MSEPLGSIVAARRVLAIAVLAIFMAYLDTTVLFVAFPSIRADWSTTSTGDLSWVLNAYTIVLGALLLPMGRLADRFGRRAFFAGGTVVFGLASLACALAASPMMLIACRALQGAGAAALLPSSLALVLSTTPLEGRAKAVAAWGAVGAVAAAVGPSVGALLVQTWGWRAVFVINLPVSAAAALLAWRFMAASRGDRTGGFPDPVGAFALIGFMAALSWSLTRLRELRESGLWLAALGLCVALGVVVLRRASSHPVPALDLRVLRVPSVRWANLTAAVFHLAFTAMFFGLYMFLIEGWHYGVLRAGLAMTPGPLIVVPVALVAGRRVTSLGYGPLMAMGGVIFAIGGVWAALAVSAEPAFVTRWLPLMLLTGAGVGLVLPLSSGAAVHEVPAESFAAASAMTNALRQTAATLGVIAVVTIGELSSGPEVARVHLGTLIGAGGLLTALVASRIRLLHR